MSIFQIIAILLTLTAMGGYVNYRYLKFPATIGLMIFSFVLSLFVIALGELKLVDVRAVAIFVGHIDFSEVFLHGMLSYMLFAAALHINIVDLRKSRLVISTLATAGVIIATFVTGTIVWYIAQFLGLKLDYLYALLFGALIAPTDPIAVLAMLKEVGVSKNLFSKIGGESLFNDGIAVVVFATIFDLAIGEQKPSFSTVSMHLVQELLGGAGLGLALGWATYRLIRSIDNYKIEVLLTLALVSGGYVLAELINFSAPICMVTAGLVIGNHGRSFGMSELTRRRLDDFWELLDDILNAVLFILMGLEIIVVPISLGEIFLGLLAIAAVLIGRVVSVSVPIMIMSLYRKFEHGTLRLLTWGGLRGGISIAMALSLPPGPEKEIILPITYLVVLFSVLVQGLTFKPFLRSIVKKAH